MTTAASSTSSSTSGPAVSLQEMREIMSRLPGLPPVPVPDCPYGDWLGWLSLVSGHCTDHALQRVRLALFAASHGCSASSSAQARTQLEALGNGTAPVLSALQQIDADLRVYELDLDQPSADYTQGPALSEEAAAHAMAYGMMAVEPGIDLLAIAALSTGGESAYAAFEAEARAQTAKDADILGLFIRYAGADGCAMLGAMIAARLANLPLLMDGAAASAAAYVLVRMSGPNAAQHVRKAQALEPELHGPTALAMALGRLKLISTSGLAN